VYEDRNMRGVKTVAATITEAMKALGPGTSLGRIINQAGFQRDGDHEPQVYTDEQSVADFDLSAAPTVTSSYLRTDEDAMQRSVMVVTLKKDPAGPLWGLAIDTREATLLHQMISLDISDRVQASAADTGTVLDDYYLERMEQSIELSGVRQKATYILSERGYSPFILDTSQLDSTTELLAL
jgi:hypothetical protein